MGSREGSSAAAEQEPEPTDGVITFDCSLPLRHSYLGQNLEELPGRTVLDDWSYYTLPLLPTKGVVLVPGQTLPLIEANAPTVKMLNFCIQADHLFGSVVLINRQSNQMLSIADVGTVAEIYEWNSHDSGDSISVKAIGRQRFRMINAKRDPQGFIKAKVQILPEIILPDPMAEIRLNTLNRFRLDEKRKQSLLRQDAVTSQWPSWVYSQFRTSALADRVKKILADLHLGPTVIPKDPVALSFWLARAIPLEDEERVTMLRLNSAIMRLQYVLKIHKTQSPILCCTSCQSQVANMTDIFTMSVEGAMGAYVNPDGYIHEIITVHKAKNLQLVGAASSKFSWFPGYAWRISQCESCLQHMGWRFTAVTAGLKPASFWALAHSSVESRSVKNCSEDEQEV